MSHKVVFFFSFFSLFFFFVFCLWFFCLIQIERASPGYSNQLVNESSMMTVIFLFFSLVLNYKKASQGPPMSMLMTVEIVYRCFFSKLFSCFLSVSQLGVACIVMTMEIASKIYKKVLPFFNRSTLWQLRLLRILQKRSCDSLWMLSMPVSFLRAFTQSALFAASMPPSPPVTCLLCQTAIFQ